MWSPAYDIVEIDVGGLELEQPAVRHRVARVDRQVHDHLLDLPAIRPHHAEPGRGHDPECDVLAQHSTEHGAHAGQHLVEIEHRQVSHLLAAEHQELARELGGPLARPLDLRELVVGLAGRNGREQLLAVAQDHRQQIVEVVGDAAGEAAHGLELLSLEELRFAAPQRLLGAAPLVDLAPQLVVRAPEISGALPRRAARAGP